jgi:signal transduction histidine kinase
MLFDPQSLSLLQLFRGCLQHAGGDVFLVDSQWEAVDRVVSRTAEDSELDLKYLLSQLSSQVDLAIQAGYQDCLVHITDSQGMERSAQCVTIALPDKVDTYLVTLFMPQKMLMDEYQRGIVAVSNHELRTPLMVINSALQLLMSKVADEDGTLDNLHRMVSDSIFRLTSTFDKLLEYGNLLTPFPVAEFREFSLKQVIQEVVHSRKQVRGDLRWHTRYPDSELLVVGDPEAISKALDAILENAMNFSKEKGDISVLVHADLKVGLSFIKITDGGIGIRRDQLASVFEGFFHGEDIMHKHTPGLGLGLTIAKKIFALHSGRIYLDSREGGGRV